MRSKSTSDRLHSKSFSNFTPTQDLRLLWTKYYYPHSDWKEISEILRIQFSIDISPQILKCRYEEYLNVKGMQIKNYLEEAREKSYEFMGNTRKQPAQFLQVYKEIKKYHEQDKNSKKQKNYEKDVIKKELYPDFQANVKKYQADAMKSLGISSISEEYQLLKYKETTELTEQQAIILKKFQKVSFNVKQMQLDNQRKISKLYTIIRGIISAQSKYFSSDIIINQINVNKYLVKVVVNIYKNVEMMCANLDCKNTIDLTKTNTGEKYRDAFLVSIDNIEMAYSEDQEKLHRKDIIKLYYFPQEKIKQEEMYTMPDGEKISQKRLGLILKMFKKIEERYLAKKQELEKEMMKEVAEIENGQFADPSQSLKGEIQKRLDNVQWKTLKRTAGDDKEYREKDPIRKRTMNPKLAQVQSTTTRNQTSTNHNFRQSFIQLNEIKSPRDQSKSSYDKKNSPIRQLDSVLEEPAIKPFFHPARVEKQTVLMHGEPKYLAAGKGKEQYYQNEKRQRRFTKKEAPTNNISRLQSNNTAQDHKIFSPKPLKYALVNLANQSASKPKDNKLQKETAFDSKYVMSFHSPFDNMQKSAAMERRKQKPQQSQEKPSKRYDFSKAKQDSFISFSNSPTNIDQSLALPPRSPVIDNPRTRLQKMLDAEILQTLPKKSKPKAKTLSEYLNK